MKKYTKITIYDLEGETIFDGSYSSLMNKFGSPEAANNYIEDCKDNGWQCISRTCYNEFEYNNPNTVLSDNWYEDITSAITYENSIDLIEQVVLKSFTALKNIKVKPIGKYVCVVLPKKYDSLIVRQPDKIDRNFFKNLLKNVYENINGKHNKTTQPKIRVAEFVPDFRTKTPYADYNEGYTFYYNELPQEEKIDKLLKDETTAFQLAYIQK